jgi:hypothetical protein
MMFSVPQFIDVEDKIAGPLTWKQLLWMIGMGGILMIFFNLFDTTLFIIAAIPTVLVFAAFAFYKPNGFPMTTFVFHAFLFLFKPKVAVWERPRNTRPKPEAPVVKDEVKVVEPKHMNEDKLKELAHILDRHGR